MAEQTYTVGDLFFESALKHADITAQRCTHRKPETELTYGQLADQVRAFGAGLLTLGIGEGDKVALFSDNRPRWLVADFALLSIGAADVPRGSDTAIPEFDYILSHSDSVAVILQDKKLYEKLRELEIVSRLRFIILMDDTAAEATPGHVPLHNFSDIVALGQPNISEFEKARKRVLPTRLATIVYTSGTTGTPKGVMLSHSNLTHQTSVLNDAFNMRPGNIQLTILPTWHAYERAAEYVGIRQGTTLLYSDKRWLREDMQKERPHFIPCVPRIWESVYDAIQDKVKKSPPDKQKKFERLVGTSTKFVHARRTALGLDASRTPVSFLARIKAAAVAAALFPVHMIADRLIYSKLRDITGGRVVAAISGGGSLAKYLDDFYEVVGITILNGYGLTETAPVLAVRRLDHNVRGTVGPPIEGIKIQIRDEHNNVLPQGQTGIVWAHGAGIMMGYYKNEIGSQKLIDRDGWLNTGDIAYIAASGDLTITGRAKDTIVLASGENIEPEPIENVARRSPLIAQILVIGQDQKQLGALVVPNASVLASALGLAEATPISEVCSHPQASKLVRDEILKAMSGDSGFKSYEQVSRVALIEEPFSDTNGLLTQTLKPKRNVITEHYKETIHKLFA